MQSPRPLSLPSCLASPRNSEIDRTACRWRITKIGLNSGIFGDFDTMAHARHPRRSHSCVRHRRSADKTRRPSRRRGGIGAHSASNPHPESQSEAISQAARFRSHDRRCMHPSHAPISHAVMRNCPKAIDAAAFPSRADETKVPHAVFIPAQSSAWSEGAGPRSNRCRRRDETT